MNSKQYRMVVVATWISLFGVAQIQATEKLMEQTVVPVTINVIDASLNTVLDLFAQQTQKNVVIGPDVGGVSNGVTLHLTNVQWSEALDVILKPYGFGYQKFGDTIVISRLDKMAQLAAVEILESKVFNLKYLDASDVQEIIKGQLSPRGSISIASARGQTGWKFAAQGNRSSSESAVMLGKLERVSDDKDNLPNPSRSKTLIVTDIPRSLVRVAGVLADVDKMPQQVLVESRIMEVNNSLLKSIGFELDPISLKLTVGDVGQTGKSGTGGINSFNQLNWNSALSASSIIDLLQTDGDTKVLSSPRVLTMNNQEATIIVGQKFPIVKTEIQNNTGSGNPTKTASLERYENSGIQLSVVPQICADGFISMIVHPSVANFIGYEYVNNDNGTLLVRYPVIDTRETETQIMTKNGETIVIGGLLSDQKKETVRKIPVLGSLPLIGRLFRKEGVDNYTKNLLIFISATVVGEDNYETIVAKKGEDTMGGVQLPVPVKLPVMDESVAIIEEPLSTVVDMSE